MKEDSLSLPASPGKLAEDAELARVLSQHFADLEAGKPAHTERLVAAHPAIAGRLRACLQSLQLIESATGALCSGQEGESTQRRVIRLGDYHLIREVGRGGMGIVYEAEQVALGRRVALKVLPFAGAFDPRRIERFRKEARAAALLHHTNIVPVFAVGVERGVHYYAMQFIDGKSLRDVIDGLRARRQKDPRCITSRAYFRTVAGLGLQAAEALAHAHTNGVVHRDIKPSNLLLDRRRNLWVTDFGVAQMEGDQSLTLSGDVVGTLRYMSPEQASATRGAVGHRADIYSLGATLHELLTLEPALEAAERGQLLRAIAEEEPGRPSLVNRAVPLDLETVVLKAMAKDPRRRYASARFLADDLRRFLDGRPVEARRPSLLTRALRWSGRHKALVACAAAVGVALVAASGFVHVSARESKRVAFEEYQREVFDAITLLDSREKGLLADEASAVEPEEESDSRSPRWIAAWIDNQFKAWPRQLSGAAAADALLADAERRVPARPEAYFYRARALLALRRKAEAAAEVERCMALDPDSLLAANLRLAVGTGSDEPAASQQPPPPAGLKAKFELAWIAANDALEKHLWKDAAASASTALEAFRTWGGVYVGAQYELLLARGMSRLYAKDYLGAIEDMGAARVLAPHVGLTALLLLKAYYHSGEKERAAALAEEQFKAGKPPDAAAIAIAEAYHDLADTESALAWTQRVKHQGLRSQEAAFYLFELGRTPQALAEARNAVRLLPEGVAAHHKLGGALSALGMLEEAIAAARENIRLEPLAALGHYNLGTFLMEAKRHAEAEVELTESLRLDSRCAEAHANLGRVYINTGRLDLALRSIDQCLDADPEFLEAHKALWTRSQILERRGDLPAAIAALRDAVQRRPQMLFLRHRLTDLLHKNHEYPAALAATDECLRLSPRDHIAHFNRGVILNSLDKQDEAVVCFLRAEELEASYALPAIELGRIFHDRGDCTRSIVHFRKALACPRKADEDTSWLFWFADCLRLTGAEAEGLDLFQKALPAFAALPLAEQIGNRARRYAVSELLGCLSRRQYGLGLVDEARVSWAKMNLLYQRQAESPQGSAQDWNDWAWALVDFGPEELHDPKKGIEYAQRAVALSNEKDATFLDTLALACFKNGDFAHAVEVEKKALALLPPAAADDEKTLLSPGNSFSIAFVRRSLEESLRRYEAAVRPAGAGKTRERKSTRSTRP